MMSNVPRLCRLSMEAGKGLVRGSRRVSTTAATSAKINYADVPKELAKKMFNFQIENGLPVHVRGGITDKILMYATYGVCAIGIAEMIQLLYVLSYPAKKE